MSTPIDLTLLAAPAVVEVIDYETLYASRKARMIALWPADQQAEVAATLALESEPLARSLQENTFIEMVLRQRINDAARAVMLAYAQGTDLDQLAAGKNLQRQVLTPADEENGIPAVMESDSDLRYRIQIAPESLSVAGPEGAYESLARNADARVLDASVDSPTPGQVRVTILARDGAGEASGELTAAVAAALNSKTARPLTDEVIVESAEILGYMVRGILYTFPGPDSSVVLATARKNLDTYIQTCHRLGRRATRAGIEAALMVPGMENVVLELPQADIVTTKRQAPNCTLVDLAYGGVYGA
ncbi:baseplate assembly protein [Pseudoduganella sp. FT55W]|uniref:Baseplate assembly protein n=1 Tax=Duganella rivi TaxID=2666083 RepID=A0A7X4GWN8_9BURK|nr:baseplate J/gp47 family protein [Duganella rivi]MYM70535.1 baseplate assembly protein [Duganella rivi]